MSDDLAVADVLHALAAVLRARGARWYLFGAQAVMVWGRPRLSGDVDVTAEVALADARVFADQMSRAGFQLRITDDIEKFVAETRVLPFVHLASAFPLDVVLAGSALEDEFLSRAVPVRIGDVSVPVMSPEDLIVTKLLAGRAKDLDDVRGILHERAARLDLGRIRKLLQLLQQALTRSDLLTQFEAELLSHGGEGH